MALIHIVNDEVLVPAPCNAHRQFLAGDCNQCLAWLSRADILYVARRRKPRRVILKSVADNWVPIDAYTNPVLCLPVAE